MTRARVIVHHRIEIDPAAHNAAAIRAYTKVGFRPVGVTRRSERGPDGTWHEGLAYEGYDLAMAMPFWTALAHNGADYTDLGILRGVGKMFLAATIPDAPRQQLLLHGDFTGWPRAGIMAILRFAASRFHELAAERGLIDVAYAVVPSPIGDLIVAGTKRGLVRISFPMDNWRIDRVAVAGRFRRANATVIPLAEVLEGDAANATALASMRDADVRYLRTSPGQRFTAVF